MQELVFEDLSNTYTKMIYGTSKRVVKKEHEKSNFISATLSSIFFSEKKFVV